MGDTTAGGSQFLPFYQSRDQRVKRTVPTSG
jgi:hypothetical protein